MRLEGLRRVSRFLRRPVVLDSLLAVLVATLEITAVRAMHPGDSPERLIGYAMAAVGAAALVARRTRPITVLAVTLAADVLNTRLGVSDPATLPTTIALYSLGRHTPARTAWITGAVSCVVFALQYVGLPVNPPGEVTLPTLGPLVLVGVGQLLRLRAELRERREQGMAEAAVRAERQRIARELHDVVAHHISVINVLVGAGRTTMATDPARAEEALRTAERTAREAMAEMRQLLHVLRADDTEEEGKIAPENNAGVGAGALPTLVEQAVRAGLPTRLEVSGEPVPLPASVDHAVYRIVQEALTNTRKHAAGARASVLVRYLPGAVEVEVLDDGSGPAPGARGGGFGLGGMAERVALCNGQLQTGPRPEGGFRVYACMPAPRRPESMAEPAREDAK